MSGNNGKAKEKKKGKKELRSFGLLVGGIFAIIGILPLILYQKGIILWAIIVAGALILPALLWPRLLSWPYRGWMAIGYALGWLNTRLILGLIFYFIFTPMGVIMRLFGYNSMSLHFDTSASTYKIPGTPREARHVEHQF